MVFVTFKLNKIDLKLLKNKIFQHNGHEVMANLLTNTLTNHRTKIEAAGVIAQISTPTFIPCQPMESYLECVPNIIKALIG